MTSDRTELLICVKCRQQGVEDGDARRAGQRLYDSLAHSDLPDGVDLRAVDCLQNCDHGCTAALRGHARWSYIYGHLDPDTHAGTLIEGAALYHQTDDGLIPWRARPEHFKRNCVARLPPADYRHPTIKD